MSFSVSVFWRFCVISFFLVNVRSLAAPQNKGVVSAGNTTVSQEILPHSDHQSTNNQTHTNRPGHHLSFPKEVSNATKFESSVDPQAPEVVASNPTPSSSTVGPHHVPVEVEKPQVDNVILDMTHQSSAAHQNMRAGKWNPTFAAIVAAICITTAVGGYIMLMAWRKIEMDRYGNRQMLINEDDFGDIQDEDMRHFETENCVTEDE